MKIQINNIEIFYKKLGSGFPLILLHGNGEDHHIFDKISKKLEKDFTIYALDSRNHGQSTKTEDYSYEIMSEDLHNFINTLHLEKVNIVGFSDGAIISLMLAMKDEKIINKMALLGVNLKPEDFTDESYRFVKQTYEETKDPLFKLMLEEPNIDIDDIKSVTTKTLIIGADQDIYKPDSFNNIKNAMPNSELITMQGYDHGSYIVDNDILYTDLLKFFN